MMQHSNVRIARLVPITLYAPFVFSSPAREETSGFNKELPLMIRSNSSSLESGSRGEMRVGLLNMAGEDFAVGESPGLNDDSIDDCIDGGSGIDVEGGYKGITEG